jgi:two-component system, NarL family, invasion response regulator UvrY
VTTRILIADDHVVVRAGLRQILAEARDVSVTGEAGSGAEVIAALRTGAYDLVILDISLGKDSGLELLPQIRKQFPGTSVLILSMFGEEEHAVRALKLGASGYLTKESASDRLLEAVRKVAQGGVFVSADLVEMLVLRLHQGEEKPHERLSNREFQILCLMGEGKSQTEIAEICCLSVKTVSTHRRNILEKMGLQKTAELIRYAVENRLSLPGSGTR